LLAAQGIGILLAGWVASAFGVEWAVGGAGMLAMVLAAILGMLWSRARAATPEAPDAATPEAPDQDTPDAPLADRAEVTPPRSVPNPEPARRSARRRLVDVGNQQQHRHRA
jgi:hypothetical protein